MGLRHHLGPIVVVTVLTAGGTGCGRAAAEVIQAPAARHQPARDQHARPRAVALDARGDLLYVALSTRNRLAVVELTVDPTGRKAGGGRMIAELPVCPFPGSLAPLPGGGVVVACRFEAGLRVISRVAAGARRPRFQTRVVDAGPEHGHQGLALDTAGRFVYVASPARGGVKIIALDPGGPPPRFVATGLSPRAVTLLPARPGTPALLLVANFIGHTVTVHQVRADGGLSAAVQTITTAAPVLALALVPEPAGPASARGAAGGDDPDELRGTLILATHEDRPLSRAHISVEGLDSVLLVLRQAGRSEGSPGRHAQEEGRPFVDPGPGRRRTINLTERRRQPLVGLDALAVDGATGAVALVGSGSDNVLVAEPRVTALQETPAFAVGAHPSAVLFLPDGQVVTADRLSDTLSLVDGSGAAGSKTVTVTVPVGAPERPTPAERGELLFYSRALVPHNVADGPLSVYTCASCHADGHIDGRRHPAKRNKFFSMTKSCRGLRGTEPFLSLGKPHTFAAFADNIVSTHAQGALEAPETFDRYPVPLRLRVGDGWTTVTLTPRGVRAALAAYMAQIPPEPSPFVAPGRRTLTEAERRGLATFRESCAGCHQLFRTTSRQRSIPSAALERHLIAGEVALTSPRLHDVGTPVLGEGGNNPPSLRNVWAAGPYFSDGSAPSLEAVLERTNPQQPKIHAAENARLPPALSAAAQADLLAFLRVL